MRLWLWSEDPNFSQSGFYPKSGGVVVNAIDIATARMTFNTSLPGNAPWPNAYPADFPTPRIRFAEQRLPDFCPTQNLPFVSERLRQAMALPADAAQFLPVQNVARTPKARAAQYWFLHVRAFAPAIDGERSDCRIEHCVSAKTQEPYLRYASLTDIHFRSGFTPPADLFMDATEPTVLFATDALAERVLAAGCTGVQFLHPSWFAPGYDQVVKTREGAARVAWDTAGRDYVLEPFPLVEADKGPPAAG